MSFFDQGNALLGTCFDTPSGSSEGFSFLGARFGCDQHRARITSGDQFLAPGNTTLDSVVLDDFI